jgi:uncharacterized protein
MTAQLAQIWRHPIKAIGAERLDEVSLTAGQVLPGDRAYALAHGAAKLGTGETWFRKMNFLRGVAGPELMAITAVTEGGRITLTHPRAGTLSIDPETPEGKVALLNWITPLWPDSRPAPAELITTGRAMTDNPDPWVSVLNLNSLRDLEARMGITLDVRRFRGNLWLDGLPAWSEFDLVGREMSIGAVRLRVDERIERCRATCVDPATGADHGETLDALETAFGHRDFGIFATVMTDGKVRVGDEVTA